jgi:hypothetical protein
LSSNEKVLIYTCHLEYLINAKGPRFIHTTVHCRTTFVLESLRRHSVIAN